jgi:hypothetical protein
LRRLLSHAADAAPALIVHGVNGFERQAVASIMRAAWTRAICDASDPAAPAP